MAAEKKTSYTSVSASWVVDTVKPVSSTSADATWVGIGGVTSNDLIQIGTAHQADTNGKIYTWAFYEMLPSYSVTISSLVVSSGDSINASVTQDASGQWVMTLTDVTTGKAFTKTVSYTSTNSSAEWIEEDPTNSQGQLIPLDNFGSVTFTSGLATVNSVSSNLKQASAQPITLVNSSGQTIAEPSAITSDGGGFTVTQY